ncbi:MAG: GHMP kinase [Thermoplasmata archaeon]|nr:GHMP kinase [Thermoplasmata archaeon]RLF55926.1 MAG: GHMP kinase [Thermoplasmata archaeon]
MIIRSKVPLRISFGGGGTDVSPYCDIYGGAVINATIDRFATVSLKPIERDEIVIKSIDYDTTVHYQMDSALVYDGQLDIIKGVVKVIREEYGLPGGVEISIQNDAPPGSGLGSSSAICVSLIGAFQRWLNLPLSPYEIAEMAYRVEREDVGVKGGRQDQYAAAFGGFNFMEFTKEGTIVNPLRLRRDIVNELNFSLVLAYVGGSHESSQILSRQISNVERSVEEVLDAMHHLKELAVKMKNALLTGSLGKFGQYLDESWRWKKRMAEGITNRRIEEIYQKAVEAGALGGKISGAGGGGYMFFFSDAEKRYDVERALQEIGAEVVKFTFTDTGLETWVVD